MKDLDRLDRRIIKLLQTNNQLTYSEIADVVGTSASSCRRRIENLRRDKVIIADISVVNREFYGPRLVVIALVVLERETPDSHASFTKAMQELPEVTHCYLVAGRCDYVVQISVESMSKYDILCERSFTANPIVKRIDSLVVMKEVKLSGPS